MTEWIGTAEAAQRLGVKQATLYSYVSRGVLRRRTGEDGRASMFDAQEVEVLARRGRPRLPGPGELVIESSLTEITGDRAFYRGHDITALAAQHDLEDVAWLLWTGQLTGGGHGPMARLRGRPGGRAGPLRRHCRRGPCRWNASRSSCPRSRPPTPCGCTWTRRP